MGGNFHNIFAGVAVRGAKEGDDDLVDDLRLTLGFAVPLLTGEGFLPSPVGRGAGG